MRRDYTEYMYEEMLGQINDINDEEWCLVTDLLGDGAVALGSLMGIVDSERYVNDISSYHKLVLDQHNTTAEKLERIFLDVNDVDIEHGSKVPYGKISLYSEKIKEMVKIVDPDTICFDSDLIATKMRKYSDVIAKANQSLIETYDTVLSDKENMLAKKATLDLFKGILSMCVDIGDVIVGAATGNPVKCCNGGFDFLNGFFDVMQDVVALGAYAGGKIAQKCGNTELRLKLLEITEDYADRDGLADEFEAAGWKEAAVLTDVIDFSLDIIDAASGLNNKYYGIDTKPSDLYMEIETFKIMYEDYKAAKKVKTGYKLITGACEGKLGESFIEEVALKKIDINEEGIENVDIINYINKSQKAIKKANKKIVSWVE